MSRRDGFKKGVSAQDGLRKREDNIISDRKNRREENLFQKRRTTMTAAALEASDAVHESSQDSFAGHHGTVEDLQQNVEKVMGENPAMQLDGTTYFRKLLSIEKRPPIDEVVRVPGLLHRLVQFLARDDNQKLQFEAAWALTNIASGTSVHTASVIESGAVPIFVKLLLSPYEDVREQAVWALGNIAGDSPTTRDVVLSAQAMEPLLTLLRPDLCEGKASLVRNGTWTLSNFCRGKPQPNFDITKAALPTLKRLIMSADDVEVLTDACWALSYLSDGPNDRIQAVIHAGVVRRLVELLTEDMHNVLVPALRTVGNIVTGSDDQTQTVINCHALAALHHVLSRSQHHSKAIVKEACWTISNITAGTKEQIDAVLASGCVQPLIRLLGEGETDIKREAAWAISNATSSGDLEQIRQLVNFGCMKPLCDLLTSMDMRIVMVALEGINNILKAGEETTSKAQTNNQNYYSVLLEDAGGLDHIEELQNHASPDVQDKAVNLLTTFFEVLPEEENIVPAVDNSGLYNFQAQAQPAGNFNFGNI